jgi:hypothetical protein
MKVVSAVVDAARRLNTMPHSYWCTVDVHPSREIG